MTHTHYGIVQDTIVCPNCGAQMDFAQVCPACNHIDARECDCEYCLSLKSGDGGDA